MEGTFTPQIETALSTLEEERERVAAEHGAFARFRRHVAAMETTSAPEVWARTRQSLSAVVEPVHSNQHLSVGFFEVNSETMQRYDRTIGESTAPNGGGGFISSVNSILSERYRLSGDAGDFGHGASAPSRFKSLNYWSIPVLYSDSPSARVVDFAGEGYSRLL